MIDLSYVFTIFFLTLGPVKTIPAFYRLTHEATPKFRQKVALYAALIATALCLFISLVSRNVLDKWHISPESLKIAGGLILLLSALKVITMQPQPSKGEKANADTPLAAAPKLAITPLTTPIIITPYGVVAILFFMFVAQNNHILELQIVGMFILMMFLNYLGMIFANPIMKVVGVPILLLIGWVFAIMQAALGIDIILRAFKNLGVIKNIP